MRFCLSALQYSATWHECGKIRQWMQSAAPHARWITEHFAVLTPGDMLERWSNGLFRSTLHRVVTGGEARDSCAFFFEPAFTTVVEALPQCCSPDNPPRFGPTTSGQHLLDRCTLGCSLGAACTESVQLACMLIKCGPFRLLCSCSPVHQPLSLQTHCVLEWTFVHLLGYSWVAFVSTNNIVL